MPMPRVAGPHPLRCGRRSNLLAVGVEGQAAVDVFERSAADAPWLFRARLTPPPIPGIPGVASTGSNMGMRGSVAAGPDYVAAGASGVEAVLVYRWSGVQQAWVHAQTLRSSRFRAVHAHDVQFRWRAEFGRSVAASGFTLLVGAPLQRVEGDAGSQALGPQHPEGATAWSGSGAVFAFHRRFGAQSGHPQQHMWAEHGMMRAQDAEPTSRFGMSVALDGDQAVIGATGSDALPNTTWDFESGTLAGWRLEGDAFLTQPTLGDNAALRPSYGTLLGPSRPQPAQPVGRYWVGTFENRRTEAAMPGDTQVRCARACWQRASLRLLTRCARAGRCAAGRHDVQRVCDWRQQDLLPHWRRLPDHPRVRHAAGGRPRAATARHGAMRGDDGARGVGCVALPRPRGADQGGGRLQHAYVCSCSWRAWCRHVLTRPSFAHVRVRMCVHRLGAHQL